MSIKKIDGKWVAWSVIGECVIYAVARSSASARNAVCNGIEDLLGFNFNGVK